MVDSYGPRFPVRRLRRMRHGQPLRDLVAETSLSISDLVVPIFVAEALDQPREIPSMPGVFQHTVVSVKKAIDEFLELGLKAVIVFGVPDPDKKDAIGSQAWAPDGITQKALATIRQAAGDSLVVMSDLCLDEFTEHGHCGIVDRHGSVDNDATVDLYARIAQSQAAAGADVVAPSGMMDGQVLAIRDALDEDGFESVSILAYAAKYASALFGPFRDAVGVSIADGGDRKTYQQDPRNRREALAEVHQDLLEGADMVMVKPATSYLDIVSDVRKAVDVPVLAYQVSGEYSMICAAASNGWIDGDAVAIEQLVSIKRAGADAILTYFAPRVASLLSGGDARL